MIKPSNDWDPGDVAGSPDVPAHDFDQTVHTDATANALRGSFLPAVILK